MSAAYGSAAYWQSRYLRDNGVYEWYQVPADALAPLLMSALPAPRAGGAAVVLGCGTSALAAWLAAAGWSRVTGVDWAPAAVAAQLARHGGGGESALRWLLADVCAAPGTGLPAGAHAAVLDKGTLDCVLCGEAAAARAAAMLAEAHRLLEPGGVFVCVSHAPPEARLALFAQPVGAQQAPWDVIAHALPKPTIGGVPAPGGDELHYVYVARKV